MAEAVLSEPPSIHVSPDTPDILKRIVARKREEIEVRSAKRSRHDLERQAAEADEPRGFDRAIAKALRKGRPAVIAEIKRASPSKGVLRDPFEPAAIASDYAANGATCLSVLTDRDFFEGHESYLEAARAVVDLPVLRKDFVVDPYQVFETRAIGADCVLLIVAALDDDTLSSLNALAIDIGLDVLVEVHDRHELERALAISPRLLGINNRDLRSFEVSIDHTIELIDDIPPETLLVSESGIVERADVERLREHDVHAFLVGEAFMRAERPGEALAELFDLDGRETA